WTRHFPLRRYSLYRALLDRHNALLVALAERHGMSRALVHERLTDPALFVDACHFTPEGIGLLAEAFEPAVADLGAARPAFREWAATLPCAPGAAGSGRPRRNTSR